MVLSPTVAGRPSDDPGDDDSAGLHGLQELPASCLRVPELAVPLA